MQLFRLKQEETKEINMTTKGSTMRYKRGEKLQDMTRTLKQWLFKNKNNPYPTKRQKMELAQQSGMSLTQVSNWFANARRRLKGTLNGAELPWEKRIEMYDVRIKNDPMESEDSAWESGEDEAKENIKIEKPDLIKDTEDKTSKPDIINNPVNNIHSHTFPGFGSRPVEGLSSPPLNKDNVPMPFVPQNLLPAPIMQSAPLATSQSLSPPPIVDVKPYTTQCPPAINEQTPYTSTHISPLAVNTPVTTSLTDPAYLSYLNMVSGVNSSLNANNAPVPTSTPISTSLPVNSEVQASLYTPIYNYLLHCEQLRKALSEAQEVPTSIPVSSPGPVPSPSEPIKEEYPKSETPKYKSTLLHRYLNGGVQTGENLPEDRGYEPPLDLRTRNRHFSGSVGSQEYENISEADTSGGDISMISHWDNNNTSEMSHTSPWQQHSINCNNNDIAMATDSKESSVLSNRVLDDWDSIPHTEEEDLAMKEICAIFTLANLARTRNLATKTEQS